MLASTTPERASRTSRPTSWSSFSSIPLETPTHPLRTSRRLPSVDSYSKRNHLSGHSLEAVDSLKGEIYEGKQSIIRPVDQGAFAALSQTLHDKLSRLHDAKVERERTHKAIPRIQHTLRRVREKLSERNQRYSTSNEMTEISKMNKVKEKVPHVKKGMLVHREHVKADIATPASVV